MSKLSGIVVTAVLMGAPAALAQAPNYQAIRVDLVGYYGYSPSDKGNAHGFGVALEPKFNFTDNLAVGLRLEGAGFASQEIRVKPKTGDRDVALSQGGRALYTFLVKADYYLTTSWARPFAGLGAGYYKFFAGSQKVDSSSGTGISIQQAAGSFSGFGFCPQLGLNLGGFRLAVAYHVVIGGSTTQVSMSTGTKESVSVKPTYNFFSFEIGGTFGGNRRDLPASPAPANAPPGS